MGIIIFFLITASGLISGSWGRVDSVAWTPRQLRGLIAAGLASVLALFVNPYGWRLVYYPFDMAFHQKLNIAHVQEWISVDFHDLRGKMALILIFGAILGALLRNRRWNLGELLVLLFALYCGLTYSRFLVLLGLVSAPILAKQLDFFPPYRPKEDTPKLNVMVLLLLFGFMVYFWPREAKIRRSMEKTYPAGVVSYLEAHPPTGNVLNFYLWGGYLGWHDPSFKVFIDSRMDIFEYAGVLKDYLDLMGADSEQHRPDPILAKYNIQYVLFPPSDSKNPLHTGGELVYVLQHDSHWKEVYQDPVSVLLMKR
ncbi:MAG: hypothetical protein JO356_18885 [Acidobacteria bacterium]|nr:hypothetical protein [Acidobacteriota bacterium]